MHGYQYITQTWFQGKFEQFPQKSAEFWDGEWFIVKCTIIENFTETELLAVAVMGGKF